MGTENNHWDVLAEIRTRRLKQLSQTLRVTDEGGQRINEALRFATKRLLAEMRHQLGAILIERIEPTDLEDILLEFACEVGSTVSSERTTEGLKEARENVGKILVGLVARESTSEDVTQ